MVRGGPRSSRSRAEQPTPQEPRLEDTCRGVRGAATLARTTRCCNDRLNPVSFNREKFVHALSHNRLHGSMGRVGACGDNAAMESFFALLQRDVLDRQRWSVRAELRPAIVTWIERTHHRRRRQRALGRLTPIEFELLHTPVATAA